MIMAKTTQRVFLYVVLSERRPAPMTASKAAAMRLLKPLGSQDEVTTACWLDEEHTLLAIGGIA